MDRFDQMSDHQVTWLDIASMFIIFAFILGSLALVSQFAGSPQTAQELPTSGIDGAATIEEAPVERHFVEWQ